MKIVLFLTICMTLATSNAQDSYGFLLGVANTEVTDENVDQDFATDELGYRVGVVARYPISEYIDFRPGFLYSTRNYQLNGVSQVTSNSYKLDARFSYLDLPLNMQLNLLSWFSIYAGPTVAVNVSARAKGDIDSFSIDDDVDDTKKLYFLGQVGFAFDFGRTELNVFYEKGFGEIYDDGEKDFNIIGLNLIVWITYPGSSLDSYGSY